MHLCWSRAGLASIILGFGLDSFGCGLGQDGVLAKMVLNSTLEVTVSCCLLFTGYVELKMGIIIQYLIVRSSVVTLYKQMDIVFILMLALTS